jgi:S1-C subfamily serine protease
MRYGMIVVMILVIALLGLLSWGGVACADPASIEEQLIKVYETARPSVVMVTTKHSRGPGANGASLPLGEEGSAVPFIPGYVTATYSGVVYDASGHIITVASAVQNAQEIEVMTWDGRRVKAEAVGADDRTGLGVIKVPDATLKPLPTAEAPEIKVGMFVVVIGNPFGLRGSMSYGIVSGLGRKIEGNDGLLRNMMQITAPINPGDAGGAVMDLRGRLVGIVYSTFGRAPSIESLRSLLSEDRQWIGLAAPESPMSAEGINFAEPITEVKPIADELIKSGTVTRGWLGLRVEDLSNIAETAGPKEGVRVAAVFPETPAEKAGVQVDDQVLAVNGKPVKNVDPLLDTIGHSAIGSVLQLTLLRDGRELSLGVEVAKQPQTEEAYRSLLREVSPLWRPGVQLGVLVQDLPPDLAEHLKVPQGALVVSVLRGSAAERSGILSRDVITALDGAPVTGAGELRRAVSKRKSGDTLEVELYRDGVKKSVNVKLITR